MGEGHPLSVFIQSLALLSLALSPCSHTTFGAETDQGGAQLGNGIPAGLGQGTWEYVPSECRGLKSDSAPYSPRNPTGPGRELGAVPPMGQFFLAFSAVAQID